MPMTIVLGSLSMGTLNYDSSIPLNIINLNCSGDEETVLECSFNTKGQEQCSTSSAVSVYCHGRICQSLKIVIKSCSQIILSSILTALMVKLVCQMELIQCKGELRCAIIMFGMGYVLTTIIATFWQQLLVKA